MRFELSVTINRPTDVVFSFLRDKEKHGDRRSAVRRPILYRAVAVGDSGAIDLAGDPGRRARGDGILTL